MDTADTAQPGEERAGDDSRGEDRTAGTERTDDCAGRHDENHPTADVLSLLAKAYTTSIIYCLAHAEEGPWRFNELESELDAAPNVLSTRLTQLVDAGLIDRRTYDEIPPRVEYRVTEKGRELSPVLRDLYEWAERHDVEVSDQ